MFDCALGTFFLPNYQIVGCFLLNIVKGESKVEEVMKNPIKEKIEMKSNKQERLMID